MVSATRATATRAGAIEVVETAGAPEPHAAAVRATGLGKEFSGNSVLSEISFSVPAGTIVGFIGPSGCGKTTLVRLMTGMYAPTAGDVRVGGRVPTQLSRRDRQDIGYLPQQPVLFSDLSVWHNLSFHASLYGVRFRRRRRLHDMLDFVELTSHRRRRVGETSGGMQRRVALAAALVHDPHLIFLDEPTAGIDPLLRRKFWDRFRALRDDGRTLVVTTQYVSEAAYCDLVAVLERGELIAIDSPEQLRRRAFGADVVEMVTETPQPDAVWLELSDVVGSRTPAERVDPNTVRISVPNAAEATPQLSAWFNEKAISLTAIREYLADYDEVFIRIIEQHRAQTEANDGDHEMAAS
jgi:ABC-2 type transport system ATP-binding protein